MSVNPKTLVEKLIKDSKGRKRLAQATSALAVAAVLITVGVLTFPAISISGSDENLREQGIDINVNYSGEEQEQVAPPSGEAPIVALDQATEAQGTEQASDTAAPITEETNFGEVATSGDTVASEGTDAPVATEAAEGEAVVEGEAEATVEGDAANTAEDGISEATAEEQTEIEQQESEEKVNAEEELVFSDAAKDALASADISSYRLIVSTNNAEAMAEETAVVANFDNIYLLQFDSAEATTKAFLRYYDVAEYVTPDVALQVADEELVEDNSDPQESVITTENVYTEDKNPFAELETALVEETTAEADTAAASNQVALIALIDTGALKGENVVESVSMLGEDATDENGHGERMVRYIIEENEAAQIISIKAMGADGKGDVSAIIAAMNYAMERGANIINISASAYASEENAALADAVKAAEEAGVIVVGAAGNNGFNARFYIPGNIKEATIVGAADETGTRIKQSNFGETVDYNVVSGSTSEAAARMSGFISANGEEGIAEVLNQGKIFATDYVAPAAEDEGEEGTEEATEGEEGTEEATEGEEGTEEATEGEEGSEGAEETPEATDDSNFIVASAGGTSSDQEDALDTVTSWLVAQKDGYKDGVLVHTWDALRSVIEGNDSRKKAIYLSDKFGGIAAYDTINVPAGATVNIKSGGTTDTIYTDATTTGIGSFFNVAQGATLNLDGVTLTGQTAKTAVNEALKPYSNVKKGKFFIEGNQLKYTFYNNTTEAFETHTATDLFENSTNVVIVQPGDTKGRGTDAEGNFNIKSEGGASNGQYLRPNAEKTEVGWSTTGKANLLNYSDIWGWHIVESGEGSYLANNQGVTITAYGEVTNGIPAAVWTDGEQNSVTAKQIKNTTNPFTVTPNASDARYTSTKNDEAFFVTVDGGTFTMTNSKLINGIGGNAAITSINNGTVNINSGSEIANNKSSDAVYNNFTHQESWSSEGRHYDSSNKVDEASSAGAINMDGGTLNISGTGISIHDNRGGLNNTAGAIRISGTQAEIKGDVQIYGNRAHKNDKYTKQADAYEIVPWVDANGNVDPTKLINAWYNKALGSNGLSTEVKWLGFYNDANGVEHTLTAWKTAGAILAENGATLTLDAASGVEGTPQIYGNTGEAGAIRIAGSNTTVNQHNATIGGDSSKPNYGTNGGAVHVDEGTYNMYSGEMSWNSAWARGGAVATTQGGTFNLGNKENFGKPANITSAAPIIAYNAASGWGGGIYVETDNVNLYYGEIRDNVTTGMGGGVYVQGDTKDTTWELHIPTLANETHHYVYNNEAIKSVNGESVAIGGNANTGGMGDGGGLWFCNFGSYLYEELYLEIFGNSAEQNGDDFSKQAAQVEGQGMGAGFLPMTDHTWAYNYEQGAYVSKNGATLYPDSVFPTSDYMCLVNGWSTDQLPDAKNAVLIHDNTACVGGGIGANGIISFRPLPTYFKVITAKLALDKAWSDGGANGSDKKVKLTVRLLDNNGNEKHKYTVELDGDKKGMLYTDESKTGEINWDKWHATIDLPIYTFNIDSRLIAELMEQNNWTEAQAKAALEDTENEAMIALIDKAQKSITSKNENENSHEFLDYGEAGQQTNIFTVDGYKALTEFENWKIEITEQVMNSDDTETAGSYVMSMKDLAFQKTNPDANYSSKYVDTGHNFFVYTDEYSMNTKLTNKLTNEIKIKKTDGSTALAGAGFTIYDAITNEPVAGTSELTTDNKGYVSFGSLKPGTYYIKETTTPTGYSGYAGKIWVTIGKDGNATVKRNSAEIGITEEGYLTVGGVVVKVDEKGVISATSGTPLRLIRQADWAVSPKEYLTSFSDLAENEKYLIANDLGYYLQARMEVQKETGGFVWDYTRPRAYNAANLRTCIKIRQDFRWIAKKSEDGAFVFYCEGRGNETPASYLYFDGNELRQSVASELDESIFTTNNMVTVDSNDSGIVINLTNKERTKVHAKKVWHNNEVGANSVTVFLYSDLAQVGAFARTGYTAQLSSANNWSITFDDLPYRSYDGRIVQYKLVEDPIPSGYVATYVNSAENGSKEWSLEVRNNPVVTGGNVNIRVNKNWDGATQTELNTMAIEVQLLSDYGQPGDVSNVVGSVTLQATNNWTYKWEKMPRWQSDNKTEVTYEVREVSVPNGFSVSPITLEQDGTNDGVHTDSTSYTAYKSENNYFKPGAPGYGQLTANKSYTIQSGTHEEVAYCLHWGKEDPLEEGTAGTGYTRVLVDANKLASYFIGYEGDTTTNHGRSNMYQGTESNASALYRHILLAAHFGYPNDAGDLKTTYGISDDQLRHLTQYAIWEFTDFYGSYYTNKKTYPYGLTASWGGSSAQVQVKRDGNLRQAYASLLGSIIDADDSVVENMQLYIYEPAGWTNAAQSTTQCLLGTDTVKINMKADITNTAKKYDFDLLKIDATRTAEVQEAIENVPETASKQAYIDAITQAAGSSYMLSGAEFALYAADGSGDALQTATTGTDGKLTFTDVEVGSYVLRETKEPVEHYIDDATKTAGWDVVLDRSGKVTISNRGTASSTAPTIINVLNANTNTSFIVIENEPNTYTLPATGGIGTQVFVIAGALLMVLAAVLYIRRTSRKEV